jgi:RNA polymerase primary sigma factor
MTGAIEAGSAPAAQMSRLFRVAVIAGAEQAVRLHISRGDDLNARDAGGMTALMLASSRDNAPVCRLLIDAGADPWLADADGRTALHIAASSGAAQALALLSQLAPPAVPSPIPPPSEVEQLARTDDLEAPESEERGRTDDDDGFGSWEAEPEPSAPEQDPELAKEVAQAHRAITDFVPFDNSTDWDDSDLLLPERAAALLGPEDAEARADLRLVLLRALREGSVPDELIDEVAHRMEGGDDDGIASAIRLAVWDLGAECDERFEFESSWENFNVHVDPEASGDEEDSVSEALAHVAGNVSTRNDPLRAYQREFQRLGLLSAEEEVKLAKAMEAAIVNACRALARWPEGIRQLLADISAALAGERTLRSLVAGPSESGEMAEGDQPSEVVAEAADADGGDVDGDSDASEGGAEGAGADELESLKLRASDIESLAASANAASGAIEERIRGLNLARAYLVELLSCAEQLHVGPGRQFRDAMAPYLRARDAMARGNLKLAFSVAKKHLYSGMELADLVQEANLGLLKAVDKFDWRKGFKFSTYATWWIRQQASRSIADKGRQVRLPVHIHEQARRAVWEAKQFENTHGRQPTSAELGEMLQLPAPRAHALLDLLRDPVPIDIVDIDECMSADYSARFVAEDPELLAERCELSRVVHDVLGALKTRERQVLCLRFGIGNDDPQTLEEIGAQFEVTRERIRQIEAKAMRNLKHPARLEPLSAALGKGGVCQTTPRASPIGNRIEQAEEAGESDEFDVLVGLESEAGDECADTSLAGQLSEPAANDKKDRVARAIELANRADVVAEDDRSSGGSVWVYITRPHDAATRALVRELIRVGFELWPGKGYWL